MLSLPTFAEESTEPKAVETASVSTSAHPVIVLGAVHQQGKVMVSEALLQESTAHMLSHVIAQSGGFLDFAKTEKVYIYYHADELPIKNDTINRECAFRFNTHKGQSDDDCTYLVQHPRAIYRVFVPGTKRTSFWSKFIQTVQVFSSFAVPIILATDAN